MEGDGGRGGGAGRRRAKGKKVEREGGKGREERKEAQALRSRNVARDSASHNGEGWDPGNVSAVRHA